MLSKLTKVPIRRLALMVASTTAIFILTSHLVKSKNHTGEIVIPSRHETGHVHDHKNLEWPPQPQNISEVIDFSKQGEEETRQLSKKQNFNVMEGRVSVDSNLKNALGDKFTRIDITKREVKNQGSKENTFTYFSREKNTTVEVKTEVNGLQSVKSIPANEYQPEITAEEITEATDIAKQYYLSKGVTRINELKGFGILAYSPNGKGFYSHRVIYISFHVDADAMPEFMAWVDLSNGTVLKSIEER